MQTRHTHILIEVSPSRLALAVTRGKRVVRTVSRRLTADATPDASTCFADLAPSLEQLVAEADCRGGRATVVYHAPAAAVLVTSVPVTLSSADAEEASRLALAGVADFSPDGAPTSSASLLVDSPAGGEKGAARQSHALSVMDRAETVEAIAEWVAAAGLRFDGALPSGAVALHGAAVAAWGNGRRAGDRAAVLWVGEYGSALACVTDGSVRFVRSVGVGLESLVDALCQPLRGREESTAELTLNRDSARQLLATVGVPAPDMPLPGLPGFTGAAILPVLQPALQRITIEAKQSLRFGLPEQDRASVRMLVVGPGGRVPGLGEWIARQCGLQLVRGNEQSAGGIDGEGLGGVIAECASTASAMPLLVPERMARQAFRRNARVALAAGVALAAAWIGGEWYTARGELELQRGRLASLEATASEREANARLREATVAARAVLNGAEARIASTLGESVDAAGVLHAVALAAPAEARVTTIGLEADGESAKCHISGFVRLSESDDPSRVITDFVERLGGMPLFRSVRLGSTQRTRIEGAQSHVFDLVIELVALPLHHVSANRDGAQASAGQGETP